ncbi:MAG: hypothetical protein JW395_0512 [Nitrospira sp.]|nr:hypothetical protein [Nitrospira sp.]
MLPSISHPLISQLTTVLFRMISLSATPSKGFALLPRARRRFASRTPDPVNVKRKLFVPSVLSDLIVDPGPVPEMVRLLFATVIPLVSLKVPLGTNKTPPPAVFR